MTHCIIYQSILDIYDYLEINKLKRLRKNTIFRPETYTICRIGYIRLAGL